MSSRIHVKKYETMEEKFKYKQPYICVLGVGRGVMDLSVGTLLR